MVTVTVTVTVIVMVMVTVTVTAAVMHTVTVMVTVMVPVSVADTVTVTAVVTATVTSTVYGYGLRLRFADTVYGDGIFSGLMYLAEKPLRFPDLLQHSLAQRAFGPSRPSLFFQQRSQPFQTLTFTSEITNANRSI